jgi:hypothetical protein
VVSLFEIRRRSLARDVSLLTLQCLHLVFNNAGTIVLDCGSPEGTACAPIAWEGRPPLEQLNVELQFAGTPKSEY